MSETSKNNKVSDKQISQENRGLDLEDILTGEAKVKTRNINKSRIITRDEGICEGFKKLARVR